MKKIKKYFLLSNIFVVVDSIALFSIVFTSKIQDKSTYEFFSYITASVFWLSLITELIMVFITGSCRKKMQKEKVKQKIGLISFMKTPEGKVIDIILFLLIITITMLIIFNIKSVNVVIPVVSALHLFFHFHCLYNGRNYFFIKGAKK